MTLRNARRASQRGDIGMFRFVTYFIVSALVTSAATVNTATIIPVAADARVQGGGSGNTNYDAVNLFTKGDTFSGTSFARKVYTAFDVSSLSAPGILSVDLVLTSQTHDAIAPTPITHNLFGIIDNVDWDPASLLESAITWNNAPRTIRQAPSVL